MNSNEYPLSLFEHLSHEAISAIFLHSIPPTIDPRLTLEPWNLTRVCSMWRRIALETPALWNNLTITFPFSHDDDVVIRLMEVAKLCLSRTGQSLISLNMDIEVEDDALAVSTGSVEDYLEQYTLHMSVEHVLQPYLGRLRQLSLRPLEGFRWALELEPGMLDVLESVSITFCDGATNTYESAIFHFDNSLTSNITAFTKARSLRAATIASCYGLCNPHVFHFPWTQLTRLDFLSTLLMFKETHEVLRQCKNLISLKIGIQADEECEKHMLPGKPFPDTFLPCLESLEVFTIDEDICYGMFLKPFILPYLKYLEVGSFRWGASWSGVLSAQCLSHLEHVRFNKLEPRAVQAFLKDAPLIKQCSFDYIPSADPFNDIIAAICCGDLVPALRVFECDLRVAKAVLVPILETRGKFMDRSPLRYATLESVVVHADPDTLLECLNGVWNRGVEITIGWGEEMTN